MPLCPALPSPSLSKSYLTNTYFSPVSVISGSVSGQRDSCSVPGTSKTLSFLSIWCGSRILGSFSSLTPGTVCLWRSETGAGHLASVERAGSHRSESLLLLQWAGWSWLSAQDVETALERRIKTVPGAVRLVTALEKNTVHPQHEQAEHTKAGRRDATFDY